MTLAFDLFFLDAWAGGPPPPPPAPASTLPPADSSSAGHGKPHNNHLPHALPAKFPELTRVGQQFWDIREAYLRSLAGDLAPLPAISTKAPTPSEPVGPPMTFEQYLAAKKPPNQPQSVISKALPGFLAERTLAISQVQTAKTVTKLQQAGAKLLEINKTIEAAKSMQATEATRQQNSTRKTTCK
jgi:hypothetical protein